MTVTSIDQLRRERRNLRRRLVATEARVERVRTDTAERVAALTARRDEARERASAAEAELEALTS